MAYAIKGGVGDFLQCLPFMLEHPDEKYYVVSHFAGTKAFFRHWNIPVYDVSFGQLPKIPLCPRVTFFTSNPFPKVPFLFDDSGMPIIGVHLGGSQYSLSTEERFGFPPKALPAYFLEHLALMNLNFYIFGAPEELDEFEDIENITLVREDNIILSLARVAECKAFIGSDSAFKTMSSMLYIPTIVLIGDYMDRHRDSRFIDPYVEERVMRVFRYWDLNAFETMTSAVNFCSRELRRCLNFQT